MNMKKTVSLIVVFLMVVMVLAGCQTEAAGDQDQTQESSASVEESASTAEDTTEATEAAETSDSSAAVGSDEAITVGISYLWLGDDYMKNMQNTFQTYAAANNITLIEKNANGDGEQQVKDLENLITSNVNAIIYQPVTASTGLPAVQDAMSKNIPVVFVNTVLDGYTDWGQGKVFAATSDMVSAGLQMSELMAKLLGEQGNIAIIEGTFGSKASDDRVMGMKWVLANYPDMTVVFDDAADWARDPAYTLMSNWLATGTQIDGVLACSSEEAIGAMKAIQDAGMVPGKDIIIITADNSEECDGYIEEGLIAGCVSHDSNFEAEVAMEYVEQVVRQGVTPATQTRYIPMNMITLENLSLFKGTMQSFTE